MALNHNPSYYKLVYQAPSPIKTHANTLIYHTPQPASDSASVLPLLATIVPSIFVIVFILITFLTLVAKCCTIWHQLDPLRWISTLRYEDQDPFIALSPRTRNHGLVDSAIREIPTFEFTKGEENRSVYSCVVCLTEFQEKDMLKVLPNCEHYFHLHCIDIWLQSNANCPLCRSNIMSSKTQCPMDHVIAPSSSPQDSQLLSYMGSDEDFVVIELGATLPQMQQERTQRSDSRERTIESRSHRISIMGDECIDVRTKDEQFFSIQPIRRSFSMDSANGRQVYLDFQNTIQQNNRHQNQAMKNCSPYSGERGFDVG